MKKNIITNKITPCCGLPFSVIYWWVSNLTLNSESDRQYLLTQISQSGVLSIDGWKVLINSGTLEADASLTKAEFLAWFNCGKQPTCEQLKLIIEGYKLGVWVGDLNEIRFVNVLGVLKITDIAPTTQGLYILSDIGTYTNLGGLVTIKGKINYAYFDGTTWSKVEVNIPKGEDGKTIENWTAKAFVAGSQVFYNGKIYEASGATVAGDVPESASVWVLKFTGSNLKNSFDVTNNIDGATMKATYLYFFENKDIEEIFGIHAAYNKPDGTRIDSSTWISTDFIDVNPNDKVKIQVVCSAAYSKAVLGFDASGGNVSVVLATANYTTPTELTIPAGVYKIKLSSVSTTIPKLFKPSKSFSSTNKLKANGIKPTDDTGIITGKDIYDLFFVKDEANLTEVTAGYLTASGTTSVANNYSVSKDFVQVNQNDIYTYEGKTAGTSARAICGYSGGTFVETLVGSIDTSVAGKLVFKIPSGITELKISSHNDVTLKLSKVAYKAKFGETGIGGTTVEFPKKIAKTWGAIGHSIWAADPATAGYQTLIKKVFTFDGYVSYAINGTSLTATGASDAASILNSSNSWTSKDIYTCDTITNDFKRDMPIGTQNDFLNNTGFTTYYGALRVLHDKLKALNPKYVMICANAVKRRLGTPYTSWSANAAGHTLTDYSNALRWVANRLSWRFIDQFQDSGINEDNIDLFTTDGLHLNAEGYKMASDIWVAEFMKIYYRTTFPK